MFRRRGSVRERDSGEAQLQLIMSTQSERYVTSQPTARILPGRASCGLTHALVSVNLGGSGVGALTVFVQTHILSFSPGGFDASGCAMQGSKNSPTGHWRIEIK